MKTIEILNFIQKFESIKFWKFDFLEFLNLYWEIENIFNFGTKIPDLYQCGEHCTKGKEGKEITHTS